MNDNNIVLFLITATCLAVIFAIAIILYVWVQKRRQNTFFKEKEAFQQALIEERERTMNEIAGEIHDNLAQMVSFAQMNLKGAMETDDRQEAMELITNGYRLLNEVGDQMQVIGKSLNSEYIKKYGLLEVVGKELEYISSTSKIFCRMEIEGDQQQLNPEKELLVYRILQEAVHNSVKHAKATEINVLFRYESARIYLEIQDNGIGLPNGEIPKSFGTGIINMRQRAKLLNGILNILSRPDNGLSIRLSCPL